MRVNNQTVEKFVAKVVEQLGGLPGGVIQIAFGKGNVQKIELSNPAGLTGSEFGKGLLQLRKDIFDKVDKSFQEHSEKEQEFEKALVADCAKSILACIEESCENVSMSQAILFEHLVEKIKENSENLIAIVNDRTKSDEEIKNELQKLRYGFQSEIHRLYANCDEIISVLNACHQILSDGAKNNQDIQDLIHEGIALAKKSDEEVIAAVNKSYLQGKEILRQQKLDSKVIIELLQFIIKNKKAPNSENVKRQAQIYAKKKEVKDCNEGIQDCKRRLAELKRMVTKKEKSEDETKIAELERKMQEYEAEKKAKEKEIAELKNCLKKQGERPTFSCPFCGNSKELRAIDQNGDAKCNRCGKSFKDLSPTEYPADWNNPNMDGAPANWRKKHTVEAVKTFSYGQGNSYQNPYNIKTKSNTTVSITGILFITAGLPEGGNEVDFLGFDGRKDIAGINRLKYLYVPDWFNISKNVRNNQCWKGINIVQYSIDQNGAITITKELEAAK